jgi:hypothetical protein
MIVTGAVDCECWVVSPRPVVLGHVSMPATTLVLSIARHGLLGRVVPAVSDKGAATGIV